MYSAQVCLERIRIMQKKKGFRYVSTMLRDADIPVSFEHIAFGSHNV